MSGLREIVSMEIADRIRSYIQEEVLVDPGLRIDVDTPLLNGLLDSAELPRLHAFIEESFGLSLEHSDLSPENFGSVRDLERFVISRQPGTP
jgi:acyl carrier protein